MPSITLLITQQQRYFPTVYDCIWRVHFLAEDRTDFRKIAAEFHRKIQGTGVKTYRKGSEKDMIYFDTNFLCLLCFTPNGAIGLEEIEHRVKKKCREVGRRLGIVVSVGEVNHWKMYLIPEIKKEVTE